jgi:hypothetical protein
MRRRDFIAGLGSAAVSPLVARAQQSGRVRIGIMFTALPPDDPEVPTRLTAFVQKLQELGWTDGRNMSKPTASARQFRRQRARGNSGGSEREAIQEAAEEFKQPATKLYAVRRSVMKRPCVCQNQKE